MLWLYLVSAEPIPRQQGHRTCFPDRPQLSPPRSSPSQSPESAWTCSLPVDLPVPLHLSLPCPASPFPAGCFGPHRGLCSLSARWKELQPLRACSASAVSVGCAALHRPGAVRPLEHRRWDLGSRLALGKARRGLGFCSETWGWGSWSSCRKEFPISSAQCCFASSSFTVCVYRAQ